MTFEAQVADIVADRDGGSSQLLARIQQVLHGIETDDPDLGQLRWAFEELRGIDCSPVVEKSFRE